MVSEERLVSLLGTERPVRVIPTHFIAARVDYQERAAPLVDSANHRPLRDLVINESHPAWIEGAHIEGIDHNEQLHHLDEGGVSHHLVVSSANRAALEAHLDSASIWLLATPAVSEGPQRIALREVVAQAVLEVKGSSVGELLAEPREETHVHYRDLLGDDVTAARDRAAAILEDALGELESAEVIDSEDRDALDTERLIDQFLRVRAEDPKGESAFVHDRGHVAKLQAHPGSVLTRFGPLESGYDLAFSIRDVGSITEGENKYWTTSQAYTSVSETLTVQPGEIWAGFQGVDQMGGRYKGSNQTGQTVWLVADEVHETGTVTCALSSCMWEIELYAEQTSSVWVEGTFNYADP